MLREAIMNVYGGEGEVLESRSCALFYVESRNLHEQHQHELLTSNFILKKTGHMDEYLGWFRYFLFSVWVFYIMMIFLFTHLRKEILLIEQRFGRAKQEQRPRRPAIDSRRADGDVEYENI
ncbi:hypothetical protein MHYP_G00232680 [Metynnis hypsauchen]